MKYTVALADEICDHLSHGEPITQILKQPNMPSWVSVARWLRSNEDFRNKYEVARVAGGDYLADQMIELAHMARDDPKGANGYKAAADILKWQAMVRSPRKYSDRLITENTNIPPSDPGRIRDEIEQLTKELGLGHSRTQKEHAGVPQADG